MIFPRFHHGKPAFFLPVSSQSSNLWLICHVRSTPSKIANRGDSSHARTMWICIYIYCIISYHWYHITSYLIFIMSYHIYIYTYIYIIYIYICICIYIHGRHRSTSFFDQHMATSEMVKESMFSSPQNPTCPIQERSTKVLKCPINYSDCNVAMENQHLDRLNHQ